MNWSIRQKTRLDFPASKLRLIRSWRQLPKPGPNSLLIFDKKLAGQFSGFIDRFEFKYGVSSGEGLKDFAHFPRHVSALHSQLAQMPTQRIEIFSLGGGSVGDFAGFFASIYRRGVALVHIPSTWLAAVDSAHGGKSALNIGRAKNQVGSFWFARNVYICDEILRAQPRERLQDALGEVIKIALLDGKPWTKRILQNRYKISDDDILELLPRLIRAKIDIVRKDPFEQRGRRALLNLGHTIGHVIELSYGLGHGKSVGHGLHFALQVSQSEGIMSSRMREHLSDILQTQGVSPLLLKKKLSVSVFQNLLLQDKKRSDAKRVKLILLKKPGLPEIRTLPIERVVDEAVSLGICRSFA